MRRALSRMARTAELLVIVARELLAEQTSDK